MRYAFIEAHRAEFSIRSMCRVLLVHFSGFYAWLKEPLSHRVSRRVAGWSMQSHVTTDLALQALLSAVWRRKPKNKVMIHSDQGHRSPAKSGSRSSENTIWMPA